MTSLSNNMLVCTNRRKVIKPYNWIDLGMARKLDVGRMIRCDPMMRPSVTSDEMSHNPQAPGPVKKASTLLLMEKPWKKL